MIWGFQLTLMCRSNTKLVSTGTFFSDPAVVELYWLIWLICLVNHNTNHEDFDRRSSSRVKQNWIKLSGEISTHADLDFSAFSVVKDWKSSSLIWSMSVCYLTLFSSLQMTDIPWANSLNWTCQNMSTPVLCARREEREEKAECVRNTIITALSCLSPEMQHKLCSLLSVLTIVLVE